MKKINLVLSPKEAANDELLKEKILKKAHFTSGEFVIEKKSIDARKFPVKIRIDALVGDAVDLADTITYEPSQNNVADKDPVIIIGAGPAGMFTALELISLGYKPIIFERGKDVQAKKKRSCQNKPRRGG